MEREGSSCERNKTTRANQRRLDLVCTMVKRKGNPIFSNLFFEAPERRVLHSPFIAVTLHPPLTFSFKMTKTQNPQAIYPDLLPNLSRRRFLQRAASGTVIAAMGAGAYFVIDDDLTRSAKAMVREDGRPRLPPGQRVIRALKPMGGQPGSANPSDFQLRIHGEVERSMTLNFRELLAQEQVELVADVHCVTGWSVLGAHWKGVRLQELAKLVGIKASARHVIFEAAHGYTANVPLSKAMAPNVLIAHRLEDRPIGSPHGAPVRAVVPDLYFWKSAKWLQGIRFVRRDQPGYWEVRGYHNHGDPWKEERYS